jgi:hypothetical protein
MMTPSLATRDLVERLRDRMSQEFDGECHLTNEEAAALCHEIDRLNALLGEREAQLEDARDYLQRLADHQRNTRGDMLYKGYADDELISLLTKLGEGSRCGAER